MSTQQQIEVRWVPGFPARGISPGAAHAEVQALYTETGAAEPEALVQRARARNNVLHPAFEWSDVEAARKYRTEQASQILRSLVVIERGENEEPRSIALWINRLDGQGFVPRERLQVEFPDVLEAQIRLAVRLAHGLRERLEGLKGIPAAKSAARALGRFVRQVEKRPGKRAS